MARRTLPLEAYDARLFDLWRRGTLRAFVLREVPPDAPPEERFALQAQLVRLNQLMNAARAAAKREAMPGWEDLYRAAIRLTRDDHGRLIRLTLEPRGNELDALLGDGPPAAAPATALPAGPAADILADLFGPAPVDGAGEQ